MHTKKDIIQGYREKKWRKLKDAKNLSDIVSLPLDITCWHFGKDGFKPMFETCRIIEMRTEDPFHQEYPVYELDGMFEWRNLKKLILSRGMTQCMDELQRREKKRIDRQIQRKLAPLLSILVIECSKIHSTDFAKKCCLWIIFLNVVPTANSTCELDFGGTSFGCYF